MLNICCYIRHSQERSVVQGRKLEPLLGKHTRIILTLVPRSVNYASTTSGQNTNHPALKNKNRHRYFAPEVHFASDRCSQLYGIDYKENATKNTTTFHMQQCVASGYMEVSYFASQVIFIFNFALQLGKALFKWKVSTASTLCAQKNSIIAERRSQYDSLNNWAYSFKN